ncbi:A disintegrin and metalloproteinase with thrombospondin motifs 4-like isoform X1 [Mytilus edulis]|uniref:A disintegrin and metalloproteinase with thrombospondin motifs 4-like isoform X1 n=3 Tax=Mytilus edulis TaxID=6550 RepID=UPI0039F08238
MYDYESQLLIPARLQKRSSVPNILQTWIVADPSIQRFHGSVAETRSYIMNIMKNVHNLFKDRTLSTPLNIIVNKVEFLDGPLAEPKTPDCVSSLCSFCRWAARRNHRNDNHKGISDVAIYITRDNETLDDLAVTHQGRMCDVDSSCLVAIDSGLVSTAITMTHDLGHLFGMIHDENTPCGISRNIMSTQGYTGSMGLHWSTCSSLALDKFLRSSRASCLNDFPLQIMPGRQKIYDRDQQCRFAHHDTSCTFNLPNKDPCESLACQVPGNEFKCITGAPMADKTDCYKDGQLRWCMKGKCIPYTGQCKTSSHWSAWGAWSDCSRPCGGGITHRRRTCRNKQAVCAHDCIGEKEDVRLCNMKICKQNLNDLKTKWCESHNTETGNYQCHCIVTHEGTWIAYPDGFDLYPSLSSHNISKCFKGKLQSFGCDGKMRSGLKFDQCGVCNGDGSLCQEHHGQFTKYETLKDTPFLIHTVPAGSTGIIASNHNTDWTQIEAEYEEKAGTLRFGDVLKDFPEPSLWNINLYITYFQSVTANVSYRYDTSLHHTSKYQWSSKCTSTEDRVISCMETQLNAQVEDKNCYLFTKPEQKPCQASAKSEDRE